MNTERVIAGIFVGAGALLLIYRGDTAVGAGLLGTMVGFFVGEKNGARNATKTA
jgi:hypothetical protein